MVNLKPRQIKELTHNCFPTKVLDCLTILSFSYAGFNKREIDLKLTMLRHVTCSVLVLFPHSLLTLGDVSSYGTKAWFKVTADYLPPNIVFFLLLSLSFHQGFFYLRWLSFSAFLPPFFSFSFPFLFSIMYRLFFVWWWLSSEEDRAELSNRIVFVSKPFLEAKKTRKFFLRFSWFFFFPTHAWKIVNFVGSCGMILSCTIIETQMARIT